MNNLHKVADLMDELGLDVTQFAIDTSNDRVSISAYTREEDEVRRAAIRCLKRKLGPFALEGTPPTLWLTAQQEINGFRINATIYSAFKCEVVGYEEETVPAEPAKPERTRKVPKYSCLSTSIKPGEITVVGEDPPEPDPGTQPDYQPGAES
jgi:hypothetical protein